MTRRRRQTMPGNETASTIDGRGLDRSDTTRGAGDGPNGDRAGLHGWITDLVHRHRVALARTARREGIRPADALDCVQDAFLSFLQLPRARLLVGMPEDSARLLTILVRNIARNRRRRQDYARPHIAD